MDRNIHGYPEEHMTPLQGGECVFKQPTVCGQYVEEITDEPTAEAKCYKPFVLRGPFLCSFMFLVLVYLALLEIVVRHYPQYDPQLMPTNATRSTVTLAATGKAANTPRQYDTSSSAFTLSSETDTGFSLSSGQTTSLSAFPTTSPAFLPDTMPTPLLNTQGTVNVGTSVAPSGAFLPISTPLPSTTPPGAFLPEESPNTTPSSAGSSATPPGAFLPDTTPAATPPSANVGGQTTPTNPYRGSSSSASSRSFLSTTITIFASPNPNVLLPTTTPSPNPNLLLPSTTQRTSPTDVPSASNDFFLGSVADPPDATHFSNSDYFIGSYSMVLAGILLRILWTLVYNNIRIMEPFYQLSLKTGARADHVLGSLYLSNSIVPDLLGSLWKNQWSVVLGSAASMLTDLFISVAAEALSVDAKHCHTRVNFDEWSQLHPCVARVVVHRWPFRFAEAILSGLFILVLLVTVIIWRRRSGIYAEPTNIAYTTSLLNHPEVVDLFKFSDPDCSGSELNRDFSRNRYKNAYYHTSSGILRYGVVPVDSHGYTSPPLDRPHVERKVGSYFSHGEVSHFEPRQPRNEARKKAMGYAGDMLIFLVVTGVLGLLVGYYKTGASSFNDFMNSGSFGPKFLFTMIGTIIVGLWKRQDRETRAKSPYSQLRTPSTAKPLLSQIHSSAWTSFPVSVVSGSFFAAFVSLNAILAEFLTVALSTIPFSDAVYWKAWTSCLWLSIAILSLMIIAGASLVIQRRTGPRLPRAPDTLANVWSYVSASYMRADFEDLALLSADERRRRVMGWGKTYMFREILDVDGSARMAVDDYAGDLED